jgi:hypothetical protein
MDVRVGDADVVDLYTTADTSGSAEEKRYQAMRHHAFM